MLLKTRTGYSMESHLNPSTMAPDVVVDESHDHHSTVLSAANESGTPEWCDGPWTENAEAMMAETGQLAMDTEGKWDYYGHSSGVVFFQQLEEFFGHLVSANIENKRLRSRISIPPLFEMYKAPNISPPSSIIFLPSRKAADELITGALDGACAIESFIHRPTFDRLLTKIYTNNPSQFGSEEKGFIPLLYAILALGCLFTPCYWGRMNYERATLEGYAHFLVEFQ